MDSEVVQALIVLPMVLVESGLFYVVVRKVWKSSRLEAALMAIGLTLLQPFLPAYCAHRSHWCGCETFRADSAIRLKPAIHPFRQPRFRRGFPLTPEECKPGPRPDTDPPRFEYSESVWVPFWSQAPARDGTRSASSRSA